MSVTLLIFIVLSAVVIGCVIALVSNRVLAAFSVFLALEPISKKLFDDEETGRSQLILTPTTQESLSVVPNSNVNVVYFKSPYAWFKSSIEKLVRLAAKTRVEPIFKFPSTTYQGSTQAVMDYFPSYMTRMTPTFTGVINRAGVLFYTSSVVCAGVELVFKPGSCDADPDDFETAVLETLKKWQSILPSVQASILLEQNGTTTGPCIVAKAVLTFPRPTSSRSLTTTQTHPRNENSTNTLASGRVAHSMSLTFPSHQNSTNTLASIRVAHSVLLTIPGYENSANTPPTGRDAYPMPLTTYIGPNVCTNTRQNTNDFMEESEEDVPIETRANDKPLSFKCRRLQRAHSRWELHKARVEVQKSLDNAAEAPTVAPTEGPCLSTDVSTGRTGRPSDTSLLVPSDTLRAVETESRGPSSDASTVLEAQASDNKPPSVPSDAPNMVPTAEQSYENPGPAVINDPQGLLSSANDGDARKPVNKRKPRRKVHPQKLNMLASDATLKETNKRCTEERRKKKRAARWCMGREKIGAVKTIQRDGNPSPAPINDPQGLLSSTNDGDTRKPVNKRKPRRKVHPQKQNMLASNATMKETNRRAAEERREKKRAARWCMIRKQISAVKTIQLAFRCILKRAAAKNAAAVTIQSAFRNFVTKKSAALAIQVTFKRFNKQRRTWIIAATKIQITFRQHRMRIEEGKSCLQQIAHSSRDEQRVSNDAECSAPGLNNADEESEKKSANLELAEQLEEPSDVNDSYLNQAQASHNPFAPHLLVRTKVQAPRTRRSSPKSCETIQKDIEMKKRVSREKLRKKRRAKKMQKIRGIHGQTMGIDDPMDAEETTEVEYEDKMEIAWL